MKQRESYLVQQNFVSNINKLLNDLKWDSLEKRRKNHKLILFYKMQNNLTPSYLTDLLATMQ